MTGVQTCALPIFAATTSINEEDFEDTFQLKSGMVRASFGIYNTKKDVDELVKAISDISEKREKYTSQYKPDNSGNYTHTSFKMNRQDRFSIKAYIDQYVNQ